MPNQMGQPQFGNRNMGMGKGGPMPGAMGQPMNQMGMNQGMNQNQMGMNQNQMNRPMNQQNNMNQMNQNQNQNQNQQAGAPGQNQNQQGSIPDGPLNAAMLASVPPPTQKRMLGKRKYSLFNMSTRICEILIRK
jgi:hypothetical protein